MIGIFMQLQIHILHEAIVEPLIMKVLKNDIFLLLFVIFCLEKKPVLLQKFISPPRLV